MARKKMKIIHIISRNKVGKITGVLCGIRMPKNIAVINSYTIEKFVASRNQRLCHECSHIYKNNNLPLRHPELVEGKERGRG